MKRSTHRHRDGDTLVTVNVESDSAVIDYDDILESITVEPDEGMYDAPWDNCDGFEHTAEPMQTYAHEPFADEMENAEGWEWSEGNRERVFITIPKGEDWGTYDHARARGASKGVARELSASARTRTVKQLSRWYRNGWEWFHVFGEYKGAMGACGGIDDYDYADGGMRNEIAEEIAAELEREGYTIVNRPVEPRKLTARRMTSAVSIERGVHVDIYPRSMSADEWRAEWRRNLNSQNWDK